MAEDTCLFCRIVAGDIPADIVGETRTTLAFRDAQPQAPTHVLVIPKQHQPDVAALRTADPSLMLDVLEVAGKVAEAEGLAGSGYRLVMNTGRNGGQSVLHAHLHVLGGRRLGWPPG